MKPTIDKKYSRATLIAVSAVAAIAVALFGLFVAQPPARPPIAVLNPKSATPQVMAYPKADAQERTVPKAPEPTPQAVALSSGQQVSALSKSAFAADAFAAYKILQQCAVLRRMHEDRPQDDDIHSKLPVSVACKDIDGGMLTTRFALLKRAVDAHVEGAAFYAMTETPDGRAYDEVTNDPAYAAWRADAQRNVEEAASRGDTLALMAMASQAGQPGSPDFKPEMALSYWTAYTDRLLASNPRYRDDPARASLQANTAYLLQTYSQGLPADRAAAAIAKGHAMVALNGTRGGQQ